nr:MAG TPA: hypothetical protein [Caudoviricetes sp.]
MRNNHYDSRGGASLKSRYKKYSLRKKLHSYLHKFYYSPHFDRRQTVNG